MNNFLFHKISFASSQLWIIFSVSIFILLCIDLWITFQRGSKHTKKDSLIESAIWISLALAFYLWLSFHHGHTLGVQFLTGYLVEKSLSVDNLFVILLVFKSFHIPPKYQHKVLFFGIFGAIVMRAIFILVGAKLLHQFHWIMYIFGAILLLTAIKFLRDSKDEKDYQESKLIKLLNRFIPITEKIDGQKFFIKIEKKYFATPLFLALVIIEATDVVFALDSIPAIFSITDDAFIAFSSNILAVLGLRALYFVLADWISKLKYLKPGLAAILGYIGLKMLIIDIFHIPSWVSLLVITSILVTAGLSSWYVVKLEELKKNKS